MRCCNEEVEMYIIFLRVLDNQSKLQRIYETVEHHFLSKEKVLITTPSDEIARYIDQLLWRLPPESFLPHLVSNDISVEHVVITTQQKNLNGAKILFNLCPDVSSLVCEFQKTYELFDETESSKRELSERKQTEYKKMGFEISVID